MEEAAIEDIKLEQDAIICFFIRQGKVVKQTLDKLQKVYTTDEILFEKAVYRCHKVFQDGQKSLTSQPKSGRPVSQNSEMNVNTIGVMIQEDQHPSIRALEELKRCLLTEMLLMLTRSYFK